MYAGCSLHVSFVHVHCVYNEQHVYYGTTSGCQLKPLCIHLNMAGNNMPVNHLTNSWS